MFIAKDINQFKSLFVNKLKTMLSNDELGAFILVLANSRQNEFLKADLHEDLTRTFVALKTNFSAGRIEAAPDDVDVFKQLLALELDELPVWKYRTAGNWELACNSLRRLRPKRASAQIFSSIKQDFDETKFHFNKAFLQPEIIWEGYYKDVNVKVFYNKFPFADYHLLVVVSPQANSPQLLTREVHDYAFKLVAENATVLPGFGLGYNSLAAGASVNHFHFQGFIRQQDFPIEKSHWSHNGGKTHYPLAASCFTSAESAWLYLEQLSARDIAFNCLYREHGCYVVPRKYQNSAELPGWLAGAGWTDVAGVITVSDEETFNSLDGHSITDALALLSVKAC
ncbi:MAG: hypothetical protein LJE83_10150 [Gammaproteobacteria bacterium]|nr:hypothetical protein [Gammaproteobacteria bacterium]